MEVRAWMRQEATGRWVAGLAEDDEPIAAASTQERCLTELRRAVRGEPTTLVVEVVPRLAGVAEAAQVMDWDKRRVVTYITRGRFPQPIQSLASGRVWIRDDVERFAEEWRARRRPRPDPA
jgi:hypothetical protein